MGELIGPRPLQATDVAVDFESGANSLDDWLRRSAWTNQANNSSRTSVIVEPTDNTIVAYIALSTSQIDRSFLSKRDQRNRPDPVPTVLVGRLAVDRTYQGRRLSSFLLRHAFRTVVALSREVGCFGIVTHPRDDSARAFWRANGFEDLPHDPHRAMIVRVAELIRSGVEPD